MAQKYLLNCPACDKSIPVEVSQAGERIVCQCGQEIEVPAMRHIRDLPRAVSTVSKDGAKKSWPLVYGLIFAVGLLTFVLGLAIAGYYQWGRSRLHTKETRWDNVKASQQAIDSLPIDVAFDEWKKVRDSGLGPQSPPEFIVHRHVSRIWLMVVYGGLGIAGFGLLLIVIALLLPRPTAKRRRAPAPPRRV